MTSITSENQLLEEIETHVMNLRPSAQKPSLDFLKKLNSDLGTVPFHLWRECGGSLKAFDLSARALPSNAFAVLALVSLLQRNYIAWEKELSNLLGEREKSILAHFRMLETLAPSRAAEDVISAEKMVHDLEVAIRTWSHGDLISAYQGSAIAQQELASLPDQMQLEGFVLLSEFEAAKDLLFRVTNSSKNYSSTGNDTADFNFLPLVKKLPVMSSKKFGAVMLREYGSSSANLHEKVQLVKGLAEAYSSRHQLLLWVNSGADQEAKQQRAYCVFLHFSSLEKDELSEHAASAAERLDEVGLFYRTFVRVSAGANGSELKALLAGLPSWVQLLLLVSVSYEHTCQLTAAMAR